MTTPRTAHRTTTSTIVNLVAVAALMIGGADVARAQSGTAQISGVVRDQQGGVLPGVTVVLRNQDSGVARTAVSEADGFVQRGGPVIESGEDVAVEIDKRHAPLGVTAFAGSLCDASPPQNNC